MALDMQAMSENYLSMRLWPVTEAHITIALLHDQYTRAEPARAHAGTPP
ncbi:hypothetical protein [Rhodococcus wratislaviensis]